MTKFDGDNIRALFEAAGDYHAKHQSGSGGSRICICGAACGGSKACSGLAILRDFFRYANWGDEKWRDRYEFLQKQIQ